MTSGVDVPMLNPVEMAPEPVTQTTPKPSSPTDAPAHVHADAPIPTSKLVITGAEGSQIEAKVGRAGTAGPHVVFLHGLVGLNDHWEHVVRATQHRVRSTLLELPLLELTGEDCSIQGVGVLTERWLAANFSEPVILVGNSFGGHVALRIAIERPELVRGLVLAGASGLIEKSMVADVQIRPSRDWLARKIGELFHDQRFMSEADLDRAFASLSKRGGARAMIKLSRSARRNHLGKKLGMIQCPTLLIWGKQDIVTPPEAAEGFLSSIRGSEIVWFDQCGHAPMIEKPAEFASALADFAERVSRAGTSGGHSAGPVVKHSGTASGTSR